MPQSENPTPVFVFGLDGATWDIAQPLIAAGRMPNLARLMARGTAGPLASTVPPISAAAWITFLTGQNPGRHGVYQFRKMDMRQYGGYRDEFATSRDYAGRSFLDMVSQHGRRVASIGVPMTYPPFPVNGFLVSGFPRPFGPRAQAWPPEKAEALGRWDEVQDSFNFTLSAAKTVETSDYWVRRYTDIALDALRNEHYDLLLVVWNSTDNIPHLFWRYTDPAFPAYDAAGAAEFSEVINHQYEVADAEIGRLLAALPNPDEAIVLVMSDHGMGPHPHRAVNLGSWLAQQGYLALRRGQDTRPSLFSRSVAAVRRRIPRQWMDLLRNRMSADLRANLYARQMNLDQLDWAATRAYRMKVFPSVEGIVLNVAGRQPQGIVPPGAAYEALRDKLLIGLAALRDPVTGQPIVARASRREDLFSGPFVSDIPDILLELHPSYTGGSAMQGDLVAPLPLDELAAYSGSHHPTGLFVWSGPPIRAGQWLEGAAIQDLAPTLLHLMGLPVDAAMDGRVLEAVFTAEAARPVVHASYQPSEQPADAVALTSAEEEAIRAQLAGLGYLRD
ncbi:MAG: alkaline phosphatase family protein [Caldilineales bacterium]